MADRQKPESSDHDLATRPTVYAADALKDQVALVSGGAGGIGRATLAGVTVARVDVRREEDGFAELETGNATALRSVPYGSTRILWKEAGTGVKWAVVRPSDRPRLAMFELSGNWTPGDSGADPPEPAGWMKMTGCKPVFLVAVGGTYAADASEPGQTLWHAAGYPPSERTSVKASAARSPPVSRNVAASRSISQAPKAPIPAASVTVKIPP